MRELKFRAWDGEKLHLWYSETHPAAHSLGCTHPKLHYLPISYLVGDSNDWVWEQFTGLKDRDGRDIYEGDICDGNWPYAKRCAVVWDEARGSFMFRGVAGNGLGNGGAAYDSKGYKLNAAKVTVIGNVHQNPELLTSLAKSE